MSFVMMMEGKFAMMIWLLAAHSSAVSLQEVVWNKKCHRKGCTEDRLQALKRDDGHG